MDMVQGIMLLSAVLVALGSIIDFFRTGGERVRQVWRGGLWLGRILLSPILMPFLLMKDRQRAEKDRMNMLGKLDDLLEKSKAMSGEIDLVKREVQYNGGSSMKDMMVLVELSRHDDFRRQRIPAFECTRECRNVIVSDPFMDLVGAVQEEELEGLNWLGFVNLEDRELLLTSLMATVSQGGSFRGRSRWNHREGDDLGVWEMVAHPVRRKAMPGDPRAATIIRYRGILQPVDPKARELSESFQWEYRRERV